MTYEMNRAPDGSSRKFRLEFLTKQVKTNWNSGMDGYTYTFNGRTYQDVKSFRNDPVEDIAKNVQITTDVHGEKVLKTYTQIPTFDSGDREWDSEELEFLFFDGKHIHLLVMRGGYRIAKLTFYTGLVAADVRMKPIFEKLGWKMPHILWLD